MSNIYTREQIKAIELLVSKEHPERGLMQAAAAAAFKNMQHHWPCAQKILVLCGGGKNGGDGYHLAALAKNAGLQVIIIQTAAVTEMQAAVEICEQTSCVIKPYETISFTHELQNSDVIVDAMCGIGLQDDIRNPLPEILSLLNQSSIPKLALDIPTGLDANTGKILGAAVSATITVTFIGLKKGLVTGDGLNVAGKIIVEDLQVPTKLLNSVTPAAKTLDIKEYDSYFKPRPKLWHKGLSGRVLIIGGDEGYAGAPRLAAEAALRIGAGLVTVATHPVNCQNITVRYPEIISRAIHIIEDLAPLFSQTDVVVLGPGLGQSTWSKEIWQLTLKQSLPLIVDADALNLLALCADKHQLQRDNWVLTPHPGEAARLLDLSTAEIQVNRMHAVYELQKMYGGTVVLKGAGTVVQSMQAIPEVCLLGNPGMASAGMGDLLTGVIAGLYGQQLPLEVAARVGVYLHARAGDLAASEEGEKGLVASDLLPYLRQGINHPLAG